MLQSMKSAEKTTHPKTTMIAKFQWLSSLRKGGYYGFRKANEFNRVFACRVVSHRECRRHYRLERQGGNRGCESVSGALRPYPRRSNRARGDVRCRQLD